MVKNYLLITFRNFLRNRNYTLINMLGLCIGTTSCILIFLLISNELRFDNFSLPIQSDISRSDGNPEFVRIGIQFDNSLSVCKSISK